MGDETPAEQVYIVGDPITVKVELSGLDLEPVIEPLFAPLGEALLERDALRAFLSERGLTDEAHAFLVAYQAAHGARAHQDAQALALRLIRAAFPRAGSPPEAPPP